MTPYQRGFEAGLAGGKAVNPYPIESDEFGEWFSGLSDGLSDREGPARWAKE